MSTNETLHRRKENAFAAGLKSVFPIYIKEAKNAEIWDVDGNKYIDFGAGIAVTNVGHCHPKVTSAIKEQAEKFLHTCFMVNPYESGVELAEKLNALVPIQNAKSIFLSTGAEAVENAVKIARAYTQKPGVISFTNAFHGRTNMCLGLTWMEHYKEGFGPYPNDIHHVPFPIAHYGISSESVLENLSRIVSSHKDIGAIIIEPIQGEGGFNIASKAFLKELRAFCDEHKLILIVDEIQSGFARTGSLFAIEQSEIEPDLITLAKGIANGIPMAAVVGKATVMDAATSVGGTYGGNPLACVSALKVLEIIEEDNLYDKANSIGKQAIERLNKLKDQLPNFIGQVRNMGAMIGIEFFENKDAKLPLPKLVKSIVQKASENGLLILSCGVNGNVIRLLPPLTIEDETLIKGLDILESVIAESCSNYKINT